MISIEFFTNLSRDAVCSDMMFDTPYDAGGRKLYATNVNCVSDLMVPIPIGVRQQFTPIECVPTKLAFYCASSITNRKRELVKKSVFGVANIFDTLPFDDYIKEMVDHKFTISPEGAGYDCFRTWECLYCGRYPVVKRRLFIEEFSKHLPIVVIDNWKDVTEEFLNNKYEEFQSRTWNYELLTEEYWKRIIGEYK